MSFGILSVFLSELRKSLIKSDFDHFTFILRKTYDVPPQKKILHIQLLDRCTVASFHSVEIKKIFF